MDLQMIGISLFPDYFDLDQWSSYDIRYIQPHILMIITYINE